MKVELESGAWRQSRHFSSVRPLASAQAERGSPTSLRLLLAGQEAPGSRGVGLAEAGGSEQDHVLPSVDLLRVAPAVASSHRKRAGDTSPRSAPPPPIGARLFESGVPPSRQTSPIANRYMVPTSSCFDEHTTSFDGSAHSASTLALLPPTRRASCALKGSRFDCAAESIRANEFAQLSRKVFAGAHLARPHDQTAPSLISQRFDCSFVSPYVCGEFVFPKLSVRLWRGSVFTPRMAMPIASMYEDGFLFRTENDIGTTRQLLDVRIEIISQCRQTTLYRLFRCRVSPPHGGHPSTGFWRWIHQPFDPFV